MSFHPDFIVIHTFVPNHYDTGLEYLILVLTCSDVIQLTLFNSLFVILFELSVGNNINSNAYNAVYVFVAWLTSTEITHFSHITRHHINPVRKNFSLEEKASYEKRPITVDITTIH